MIEGFFKSSTCDASSLTTCSSSISPKPLLAAGYLLPLNFCLFSGFPNWRSHTKLSPVFACVHPPMGIFPKAGACLDLFLSPQTVAAYHKKQSSHL
jgi:hypothetical protein